MGRRTRRAARERYKSGRERFEVARARLVLDPAGDVIAALVADLTDQVNRYDDFLAQSIPSREMDTLGDEVDIGVVEEEIRAQRRLVATSVNKLIDLARDLLDEVRRQPLEEDTNASKSQKM